MKNFKKLLIDPEITVNKAIKQMDEVGKKILFVIDGYKRLLGTVSDGDIRRWILKKKDLNEKITKVMNRFPKYLNEGFTPEEAKEIMVNKKIESLPVLDGNRQIVAVTNWVDYFEEKSQKHRTINLPVVIMGGGEGMRLHPFTKILPKPLMPIGDKPIIEIIIDRFFAHGCRDFYLSLNYKSNIIKAYFSDFTHKYKVTYVLENKPLGTAGSLSLLKNKIKKTFFISNCDILVEADYADILRFHRRRKNKITLISSMKNFTIPYGVCEIENGGILKNIREKPEYDFLVNTGMYVLDQKVLEDIPKNRFYNITDLIADYLKRGEKIGVYPVSEKSWMDIGQLEVLQETLKNFGV